MAFADLDGCRCYYRIEGQADRPVTVLSHSLGLDHGMWDPQMPALLAHARVLRYDVRGHGASDAPSGDYTIEQLGRDALLLLDRVGVARAAWCGVSLGGMVGQWLAAHAPERVSTLVLANTSPRVADPAGMGARRQTVLDKGMSAVEATAMTRFFGGVLLEANPPRVASARETLLATNPVGYAGCCAALRDFDGTADLTRIQARTLVVSGDADESMPWESHGDVLRRAIPNAASVRLATAHLSNLCVPRTFTRVLLEFLEPAARDAHSAGLDVRRAILGTAYVAQKQASATDLTAAFQDLITRYAWGEIWTRPGLDAQTRRLLVLATTAALGRWEEFRLHLAAGLDRDLEWSDVEEVLLQTAVYAGVPVGNTGFAIAAEERNRRRPSTS
jgi:3-oxoadipate enol-lactonase/4-carboxymuconolactone decarboxylase